MYNGLIGWDLEKFNLRFANLFSPKMLRKFIIFKLTVRAKVDTAKLSTPLKKTNVYRYCEKYKFSFTLC